MIANARSPIPKIKRPASTASVISPPTEILENTGINEIEDGLYAVHFVPKELKARTVSVKYKDIYILDSLFQYTISALHESGAHREYAGGPGLKYGETRTTL
ncbi:hypothetical protein PGB90_005816 [Kerria lacca]